MKLFWHPQTRSNRALWMLEELNIDYDKEIADIKNRDQQSAEFKTASPMGKVPALVDGEVQLADSSAICFYLADKYSYGDLAPTLEDPQRGAFYFWMMYTPGVIEPAMGEKANGWKPNKYSHGWGDFDTMISTLETQLENRDWLLDRFTAADVTVGSSVAFLQMFKMLPESPVLEAYAARCLARPAYQRALALG